MHELMQLNAHGEASSTLRARHRECARRTAGRSMQPQRLSACRHVR